MSSKHQQRILLKQARIKNIPEGWKISTVENACEVKNNLRKPISVNERALIQGKFPYYGPTGILDYINEYQLDGKYALIGEDGDHFLKYQSWSQTQLIQGKFNVNNHAHVIAETKECLVEWFFVYYQHRNILNFVSRQGAGRYKLNKASLFSLPILLPPLDEQKKIAEILGTCDRALELTEKLLTAKRKLKQALIQKIFSRQIRFKKDDGSDFPNWQKSKLGFISDVRDGTHDSPKYHQSGFPLITSKNLSSSGEIEFDNVNFINEIDYNNINKRSKVSKGDILFGMIGTIGNPVLVKNTGFAIKNVALIKEKELLKNRFLIHYLNSFLISRQFHKRNTGGTQKFIGLGVIRDLTILLPTIEEQNKIAIFLEKIDLEIMYLNKLKYQYQEEKKGLMQQLLTGKIRVN